MARYRRRTSSSRYAPRRRSTARPRRRATRRRSTARTQRVVIQVVSAPGGVLASPQSLGSKTLRPLRARF